MDQIGATGHGGLAGIPASTITWNPTATAWTAGSGAPWTGGASISATIFGEISCEPEADQTPGVDNAGEQQAFWNRNRRYRIRMNAKVRTGVIGTLQGPVLVPKKGMLVLITCATDADVNCDGTNNTTDTALVESVSKSYTPEGEMVIDFTITKHSGKLFSWPT